MIHESNVKQVYLVGDLHLGVKGNSLVWSEIQEDYLLKTFTRQLLQRTHIINESILILEGDIFHSRQSIDVRVFDRALTIFKHLSSLFRTVYIILGNHDVYYKEDNSLNSVGILAKLFPNIKVFENPEVLKVNNEYKFLLLPWVESVEKITEIIEDHSGKCQYIICHADIQNASLNSFSKMDKGIDLNVLKTYKRIYSGHIHLRQEIKKYGASVSYTGTPYSMDKNDVGNQKGFDILSFVEGEIVETFVPNDESPIFVKKNLYTILEMNVAEIEALIKNNFVEIQVDTKIANRFSIQVFMDLIKDMGHRKIEFSNYTVTQKMDAKAIAQNAVDASIDLSIPNMMNMYLDQKGYDRVMRKRIERKFETFMNKVKEQQKTD